MRIEMWNPVQYAAIVANQQTRHAGRRLATALIVLFLFGDGLCFAGTSSSSADIPFEWVRNSVVAKVGIDGNEACDMLIDTGADPSIVDLKFARQIGLRIARSGAQGEGGGNDINPGYATILHRVTLGGATLSNVNAEALSLAAPSERLGRPLCGIIGYNLLKRQVVQFDYPNRVVRFFARRPTPVSDGATIVLHSHYSNDLLVRGLKVNGRPVVANFDTGSNGGFQLTAAAVERLSLQADAAASTPSESVGFNGKTENRTGTVEEIRVGPQRFANPQVTFYGAHTGRDNVHWDIRVGNAFLSHYAVTFDLRQGTIILEGR
jgi:predicted aspartyl protease